MRSFITTPLLHPASKSSTSSAHSVVATADHQGEEEQKQGPLFSRTKMASLPAFATAVPCGPRLAARSNFLSPRRALAVRNPARHGFVVAVACGEPVTAAEAKVDGLDVVVSAEADISKSTIQTLDDVEEIIALADEFNLFDFRIQDNGVAVEISRAGGRGFEDGKLIRQPVQAAAAVEGYEVAGESVVYEEAEGEGSDASEEVSMAEAEPEKPDAMNDPDTVYDSDFVVTSNRVGFFYSGAKNKPPLVNVGDHVDFNQPVCIIEQLGQQYVYLSEASGTVLKIFVEDGDAVEYDQQVMVIRPD